MIHRHECRPQFLLKFSELEHITQCIWKYVSNRLSSEYIEISFRERANFCSKNQAHEFKIQGMWRRIDSCMECPQCKSMQKSMSMYRWKHAFIYDTFEFQQKWYFSSKDLKGCKYGKSIAFAGDSVTKKGYLISARKFNIHIETIDLYNIF